ncbi:FTR1 family iron permease, partial [Burkholderia cenocepacia]|uniref:FTR1 family iron permease n=1 Tax=Burkholderia cenocepacia TaxID=95486 RepID=UPI002349F45E
GGVLCAATRRLGGQSSGSRGQGREWARRGGAGGRGGGAGSRPLTGLAIVVGVAVLREGSEAVLFLYGIAAGDPGQTPQMIAGGLLGVLGGAGLGYAMYAGLLQIPLKRLFSVTNGLIVLLAAGMASQCVGFLLAAGLVPSWGDAVWDTSWLLKETSIVGKALHTLIGYTARPAGIQIAAYVATLVAILVLARFVGRPQETVRPPRAAA